MDPLVFWLLAKSGTYTLTTEVEEKWQQFRSFLFKQVECLFLFFAKKTKKSLCQGRYDRKSSKKPFIKWVSYLRLQSNLQQLCSLLTGRQYCSWRQRPWGGNVFSFSPATGEWWWIFLALLLFIVLNHKIVHDTSSFYLITDPLDT